jgi:hypothetical protein
LSHLKVELDPDWWKPMSKRRSRGFPGRAQLVRVLVDTSTFIWIISRPTRLSKEALRILKKPNTVRELSTLSLNEIAIKVLERKLDLT